MEYINIANIRINKDDVTFEFLYKSKEFCDNIQIFFEDEKSIKYNCSVTNCKEKVHYEFDGGDYYVSKVLLKMPQPICGKYKIILAKDNNKKELKILDNRNEIITEKENPYIIFVNKYKIEIKNESINISNKKFGDKIKYEVKKHMYGIRKYKKFFVYRFFKLKRSRYYLFNDRLMYGDDNAEQIFRYINEKYPKFAKKCYFVLDKNALCIKKIKEIGNVAKYGSIKHKFLFINSRMIISSHSSYFSNCFNPFSEDEMNIYKDIINKKFAFLQHGVIMNDVRQYHNRELNTADLFITSTKSECSYMQQQDFMYEPDMVVCTGLPRFDRLKNEGNNKIILFSPTWRAISNEIKFEDSEYYNTYKSLLSNVELKSLLKDNGYRIKFLLHPVFAEYKGLFMELANENIEILETSQIKYYKMFNECNIFITDYSSIHFDVAFLRKPIIYYQFDKEYFFSNHYQKGYFSYEEDGFGNVVETENDLINEIKYYIQNNATVREEYNNKIKNTFMYLDNDNSKRVFEKILELDEKNDIDYRFNNVH